MSTCTMEKLRTYVWVYICMFAFVHPSFQDDAANIHGSLMKGYNRRMRPGLLTQKPVRVYMEPHVNTIKHIHMKDQAVEAELSVRLQWGDARLTWNKTSFENVSWIMIETDKIWIPELVLSSHNASRLFVDASKYLAIVRSDGWVNLWVLIKAELVLDLNLSKYPFDEQVLEFAFESWTYIKGELMFVIEEDFNPIISHKQSGEWDLLGFEIIDVNVLYSDGEIYHQTGCRVLVKRRVLYHIVHVIGPVLLISLLNILCFVLPTSSGERVSLSMTIFLTLTVLLSSISDSLPKTSLGVPIIVVYISLQMVGSMFTIVMTVILIWYSQAGSGHHIPKLIKRAILCRCCKANTDELGIGNEHHEQEAITLKRWDDLRKPSKCLNGDVPNHKSDVEESSPGEDLLTLEAVSSWVHKACFWLAILWNVALLAMLLIYVAL